jgi:hypothetical protein
MSIYHKEIFIPTDLKLPNSDDVLLLRLSSHVKERLIERRMKVSLIPSIITTGETEVIEIEADNNKEAFKLLLRKHVSKQNDLVMAICKESEGHWLVKTAWKNDPKDSHKTLDKSRYDVV